jgi:hypothetical protein
MAVTKFSWVTVDRTYHGRAELNTGRRAFIPAIR